MSRTTSSRIAAAAAALVMLVIIPGRGRGEMRLDWSAWLGCWQPVGAAAQDGVVLCMLPGADAQSVRVVTIAANTIREQSVIRPDGVGRPAAEGGCTGLETATWSSDRRRVFIRTELECGSIDRTTSSVLAFVASNEFIDAQAITVNGQHAGRSVRYRALPPEQTPAIVASELAGDRSLIAETARLDAFVPLDTDDVIEAAERVAPPALEALLAARNHGFALDARSLLRLEDGGVPRSVMNVMIALSYPKQFNVQDNAVVEEEPARRYAGDDAPQCYDPYFRTWRYGMDCYAYYSPYYFDSFGYRNRYGYGFGGSYNYPWSPTPVVVIVRGEEPVRGEVVKGQGYTNGSGRPTGAAVPRSSTSSAGSSATERATSSGSGGSSSSGSGSATSSGSSGSSTGRTAVRKGGDEPPTPPPEPQRYEPAPVQTPAPRNDPPPATPRVDPPAPRNEPPPEPPRTAVRKPGGN